MKKIMFGMLSIALLAGCSNDEVLNAPIEGEAQAIAFTNAFVDNPVRASQVITSANLEDFSVFGYTRTETEASVKIFDNEIVTKQDDGTWTYVNTQYWNAGKDYLFHAVGPHRSRSWEYIENTSDPELSTIIFINNGDNDLVLETSILHDVVVNQPKVQLTFSHLLSRVKFAFTNHMNNSLTQLQVTNIKVIDVKNVGTYHLQTLKSGTKPYWTNDGSNVSVSFGLTDKIDKDATKETQYMYYIPTTNDAYTLQFTVNVYQSNSLSSSYDHEITIPAMEYKTGHSYLFTATLNASNINPDEELKPIEFTVKEVEAWEADENTDLNLPLPATP